MKENPAVHHETTDVDIRAIFVFGAALIVSAVIISFLVWVLFKYFEAREARRVTPEYPLAAVQQPRQPPEPRLQTNPREDLQQLREEEEQILDSYGWVDKNAGVVRIPIEEAMKLTVQRGLPARSASEPRR
jgi:hypothetical protein